MSKQAQDFLREAASVIEERGKLRDKEDGERSMLRAVSAYRMLRGNRMDSELNGWLFMCVLKMARATAGNVHIDDWVDLCGYAALGAECASREKLKGVLDEMKEEGLYNSEHREYVSVCAENPGSIWRYHGYSDQGCPVPGHLGVMITARWPLPSDYVPRVFIARDVDWLNVYYYRVIDKES